MVIGSISNTRFLQPVFTGRGCKENKIFPL
jgi:hypothetical protein